MTSDRIYSKGEFTSNFCQGATRHLIHPRIYRRSNLMILACGTSRRIIKENVVSFVCRGRREKEDGELSLNRGAAAPAARVSGYEFVVENSLYLRTNGERRLEVTPAEIQGAGQKPRVLSFSLYLSLRKSCRSDLALMKENRREKEQARAAASLIIVINLARKKWSVILPGVTWSSSIFRGFSMSKKKSHSRDRTYTRIIYMPNSIHPLFLRQKDDTHVYVFPLSLFFFLSNTYTSPLFHPAISIVAISFAWH